MKVEHVSLNPFPEMLREAQTSVMTHTSGEK
jgi:hypothetical protein